jgi:hypothetical protein
MICEQCHIVMVEQLPDTQKEAADEEQVIVFSCPQCGHTEHQLLIASFWRRLAA